MVLVQAEELSDSGTCTARYGTEEQGTAQHGTAQHHTAQHGTTWHGTEAQDMLSYHKPYE